MTGNRGSPAMRQSLSRDMQAMTSLKIKNREVLTLCEVTFLVASFFYTTFAPQMKNERENIIQLVTAAVLSIGGLVMLFCGVYIDPLGQIHESLLIGFGEVATFAGALFGIDYTYKFKQRTNESSSPDTKENGG